MSKLTNKNKMIGVRVTQELWDAFSEIAKKNDDVPSKLIRDTIVNYLENDSLDRNYLDYLKITNGYEIEKPERKIL